jgi:magnesium-transporting ATPase (P-type)
MERTDNDPKSDMSPEEQNTAETSLRQKVEPGQASVESKPEQPTDEARLYRYMVFALTFVAFISAFWFLHQLIRKLVEPAHTFGVLAACAGFLVLGGLVFLVFVIPAAASSTHARYVKTEFHSAKAAYLCVAAGLTLFIVIAVGVVGLMVAQILKK